MGLKVNRHSCIAFWLWCVFVPYSTWLWTPWWALHFSLLFVLLSFLRNLHSLNHYFFSVLMWYAISSQHREFYFEKQLILQTISESDVLFFIDLHSFFFLRDICRGSTRRVCSTELNGELLLGHFWHLVESQALSYMAAISSGCRVAATIVHRCAWGNFRFRHDLQLQSGTFIQRISATFKFFL